MEFIKIPFFLFMDQKYKSLSSSAKLLYGIFSTFAKDGSVDFSREDIKSFLCCSNDTAAKTMKELEGADLIYRESKNGKCMNISLKEYKKGG